MLIPSWLQTPLNLTALDVSCNEGGLPWFENISWKEYLPSLTRLVFRGNKLSRLRLDDVYNNPSFPPSLYALDLTDNPNLIIMTDSRSFGHMVEYMTVSADPNSYDDTLLACENQREFVIQLRTNPVHYSSQGNAIFDTMSTPEYFYVCAYYDINRSTIPSTRTTIPSTGTTISPDDNNVIAM
ncbi:hypothetical protein AC1031_011293 [Aphanomyces cochlioides]|nr:hypothetical protein AC1031_011293 [Aphanomyces cochlioides]